ncbi:MAG: ROK family protein [Steroidobacteraceae bacterium]
MSLLAGIKTPTLLGLDIGGTKLACVEGDRNGRILQREELPTLASQPFDTRFPAVVALMKSQIKRARAAGREVTALSVAIGGPLNIADGILFDPPHLPGWHQVRLKQRLAAEFPDMPIALEHDGNAGALAEFHFGVGRGRTDLRHLIFLTFGTGLGAGFILNGQIFHGASDSAGEIGHWRLSQHGPVGYGKTGSWESYCSGAGLVLLANRLFPSRWSIETPIRSLVDQMLADDADALKVAQEAGRRMGQGLALLVDALNPQIIVLGSLAVALGDKILVSARQVVQQEALPNAAAACSILPSALGTQIGDVASLMAALTDPRVSRRLSTTND